MADTVEAPPNVSVGATYLGDVPRSTTVTLQHPFELDGVQVREVTVRRLRGFEAKQFAQASLAAAQAGLIEPVFPGVELSSEAYAILDDDDVFAIDEAIEAFMPARFRVLSALVEKMGSPGGGNSVTGGQ